jgi:hypothetical protein
VHSQRSWNQFDTELWNIQAFDFIGFCLCVGTLELRHIVRCGRPSPFDAIKFVFETKRIAQSTT